MDKLDEKGERADRRRSTALKEGSSNAFTPKSSDLVDDRYLGSGAKKQHVKRKRTEDTLLNQELNDLDL